MNVNKLISDSPVRDKEGILSDVEWQPVISKLQKKKKKNC